MENVGTFLEVRLGNPRSLAVMGGSGSDILL